ncbi:Uncharacterised protein [Propionibacterium australiense]|uniref:Uncharacterized protein n=1 Tax=Propionibacterium australiense TaxID=119981 RepID=A0A383S2P8_9ACTN|nr:Hypothetical protein PROPAUS_0173 [Propionibacterium australiense]VEH90490.1 Uncharacterised protein [Propionibacterium australiense]
MTLSAVAAGHLHSGIGAALVINDHSIGDAGINAPEGS